MGDGMTERMIVVELSHWLTLIALVAIAIIIADAAIDRWNG